MREEWSLFIVFATASTIYCRAIFLLSEEEKERLGLHKELLTKLVKKKTSYREKKKLIQEGGFLGSLIPTLVGLVGKLFTGQ